MNFKELVSKIEGNKIYFYSSMFSVWFLKDDFEINVRSDVFEIKNGSCVISVYSGLHFYKCYENEFITYYKDDKNLGYIVTLLKEY